MRDCVVLGTGRSGTSLVTGFLAGAGYDVGDGAWRGRAANPHGFFETPEINAINERLLAPVLPAQPELLDGQRWLGLPERAVSPSAPLELQERMSVATERRPFAYKDPRFSFTLPAWRPFLGDAAFVTVFRHPAVTLVSMLEEVRRARYLAGLTLTLEQLSDLWIAAYRSILDTHSREGEWLFLHYEQALAHEGHVALGSFLGAPVDGGSADPKLRRPVPSVDLPQEALGLYAELCERAGHRDERTSSEQSARVSVSVVALIGSGDENRVEEVVEDVRAQRGVTTELILVDATRSATGSGLADALEADYTIVRSTSASACDAWQAGIDAATHDLVALQLPGCRALPSRLAHAVAALEEPGADLVTCDYWLEDEQGQFVSRSNPARMGAAPGPYWVSGVVARRSVFESLRRAAFWPGELELLRRLQLEQRVAHVEEPGFSVDRRAYADGWDESRLDAQLVTLDAQPWEGPPELSVSLCTYDRPEVFLESLSAFARQRMRPGAFEIVIVDDGDPAGTQAALEGLELAVPITYLRGPASGLAAARNAGLQRSCGALVLFVNDDTIPFPDAVETHLRTHAQLGRAACVQGTFEQPAEAQRNALLRYLEESNEVFGYADMRPGEWHDAFHFYTCNVSVPLAEVRAVGGFDESFRFYGCEDTDLGVRLAERGCKVFYADRARALHRHPMDIAYLERRQRTVSRAYVQFFCKHPELLSAWGNEGVSRESLLGELEGDAESFERDVAVVRELAGIDVGALEHLRGEYAETAQAVLTVLAEKLPSVNRGWWRQGYLDGFEEHGIDGFEELAKCAEPWPIATEATRTLLAFPRWDEPQALDRLFELAAPLTEAPVPQVALVLRRDPQDTTPRDVALEQLGAAFERRFSNGEGLEVVLEEAQLDPTEMRRLGATVDALLITGYEVEECLAPLVCERLDRPERVRAWSVRFEAPARRSVDGSFASRPELSVLVATRDRARELAQVLECLLAQDLEPQRFEVVVVDDGSQAPVQAAFRGRSWPFEIRWLEQPARGPAAARNLGLRDARGEIVVFLNDDAVPGKETLRRHLESHRLSPQPVAVLGSFRLQPRHVVDSFAHWVETSTALFAQPAMVPGVVYDGLSLCTGNVSVPRECLARVGGFDDAFPWPGGEDSELGIRLERDAGVRVLFDPRIACEHDHALDLNGFVLRRQVVGWAAWRMFVLHGVPEVLGTDARPLDESWWRALTLCVQRDAGPMERLQAELAGLFQRERETGFERGTLGSVRPALERLAEHAFRSGLLAGRDARNPLQIDPPAAMAAASPSANAPMERVSS